MTAIKATPLDLIAIRQHILSELGVVAWALKSCETTINPKTYQSRLTFNHQNNTVDTQIAPTNDIVLNVPRAIPPTVNIGNTTIDDNKTNKQPTPIGAINTNIPPKPPQTPTTPTIQATLPEQFMGIGAKVERFELFGLSYQNWVVLVDNSLMTAQQKSIWASLVDKLSTEGVFYLQVHYPLVANEYREYENFSQGTHSLLGFLLRLCANKPTLKLALLTPLSDGIDLGNLKALIETTPTLQEMGQNPQSKKTFWHLLHS